jgi:hypothetical protein
VFKAVIIFIVVAAEVLKRAADRARQQAAKDEAER